MCRTFRGRIFGPRLCIVSSAAKQKEIRIRTFHSPTRGAEASHFLCLWCWLCSRSLSKSETCNTHSQSCHIRVAPLFRRSKPTRRTRGSRCSNSCLLCWHSRFKRACSHRSCLLVWIVSKLCYPVGFFLGLLFCLFKIKCNIGCDFLCSQLGLLCA